MGAYLTSSISSIIKLYSLTFVQPYTFDKNFTTTYNLFNTESIFSTYDYKGSGGGVTVSRPLTEFIRASLGYRLQRITVYNIESDAGTFIRDQIGTSVTSAVSTGLVRNTIDDVLNPSKGSIATAMVEVAGSVFGGENKFVKSILSYGKYIPFYWDTTFFLKGTAGNITPYGGTTIPVFERFFVGGIHTMRGFKYGMAGPLDPTTGDVIGATNELIFSSEWIFNVYKPAGLKGFLFFDYGKGFNSTGGFSESLRPAAGFGMKWFSPMGPITVVLGLNLNKKPGESRTSSISRWGGHFNRRSYEEMCSFRGVADDDPGAIICKGPITFGQVRLHRSAEGDDRLGERERGEEVVSRRAGETEERADPETG